MNTKRENYPDLVVTQLRSQLEAQVKDLERYLEILETQDEAIVDGNYASVSSCIEHNHSLAHRMQDIQKVITPLQQLYKELCPEEHQTIRALHSSVELLRVKAITHSHCLVGKIRQEASKLKEEIHSIPRFPHEVFSEDELARYVDMQA